MSNLHRIQWIDMHIRAKKYPNCSTIAEEFCISRRQASRDVEYLRYSLNAPVEYSPERNGYYYTDDTYNLPSLIISRQEKEILSYLADQYKNQGSEMALQLADLFTRLGGGSESHEEKKVAIPVYSLNRKEIYCIRSIESAIHEKKKARIQYIDSGNVLSVRIIHPYKLFIQSSRHYLAAYCEKRQEERVFRVARIRQIRALEKTFKIPAGFNPENYGEHFIFHYRLPYQADVRFDKPVKAGDFTLPIQEKENLVYRISFRRSQELIAQLVSTGVSFQILKPEWVKDKLKTCLTQIIDSNS